MIWREPSNHQYVCYFCVVIIGINRKNGFKWIYPSLRSASRPVPISGDVLEPQPDTPPEHQSSFDQQDDSDDIDFVLEN